MLMEEDSQIAICEPSRSMSGGIHACWNGSTQEVFANSFNEKIWKVCCYYYLLFVILFLLSYPQSTEVLIDDTAEPQ